MTSPLAHEQAQSLLSDYVEGGLSQPDRQAIAEHLKDCDICREELDLLGKALPLLQGMPKVQAPDGFAGRVRRRMRKSGIMARRRRRNLLRMSMPFTSIVTMAVLMAAVGAMLVVVMMMQQQIEFLIQQQPPARLQVDDGEELQKIAAEAWALGAEVRLTDQALSPGSDLSQALEIELRLQRSALEPFLKALDQANLQSSLVEGDAVEAGDQGQVRLLVQRRQ